MGSGASRLLRRPPAVLPEDAPPVVEAQPPIEPPAEPPRRPPRPSSQMHIPVSVWFLFHCGSHVDRFQSYLLAVKRHYDSHSFILQKERTRRNSGTTVLCAWSFTKTSSRANAACTTSATGVVPSTLIRKTYESKTSAIYSGR